MFVCCVMCKLHIEIRRCVGDRRGLKNTICVKSVDEKYLNGAYNCSVYDAPDNVLVGVSKQKLLGA